LFVVYDFENSTIIFTLHSSGKTPTLFLLSLSIVFVTFPSFFLQPHNTQILATTITLIPSNHIFSIDFLFLSKLLTFSHYFSDLYNLKIFIFLTIPLYPFLQTTSITNIIQKKSNFYNYDVCFVFCFIHEPWNCFCS